MNFKRGRGGSKKRNRRQHEVSRFYDWLVRSFQARLKVALVRAWERQYERNAVPCVEVEIEMEKPLQVCSSQITLVL